MVTYKKLWLLLVLVVITTFTILGYYGAEIYRQAPPIPKQYVSTEGKVILTSDDILIGQSAWQSVGGMQLGSILGHGAYQAPDWTADWLHRELIAWLDIQAQLQYQQPYETLSGEEADLLRLQLKREYRQAQPNADVTVVLSDTRIEAMAQTGRYYASLFGNTPDLKASRVSFAMKDNTLPDAVDREKLGNFFFWTAWMAATERPDSGATYTNNWPHEPLIDNVPTAENIMWSIASIVLLLVGVGFMVWIWAFTKKEEEVIVFPKQDPIARLVLTPSQKSLGKYVFLVVALFAAQFFVGGFTAHYTVEGQEFYGIDVSQWFPYALVRTWHIQLALFWIATAFLAVGLFLGPIINGGKDPKYQRLGVDLLFWALIIVVVGSFIGNYVGIAHVLPKNLNFWFGHQGYEFIDLGRFWQILKWVGILFWLALMLRCMLPSLHQKGDKHLQFIFLASVLCVGLFYGSGLFYGEHTHITVMEYWRWWVVHLWVEGFFEVFATASLAVIFYHLGLVSRHKATLATLASASLFLIGGVPGTFHHLYFSGTTTPIMAVGASFSALEVVPLILLGYEGWENSRLQHQTPWMQRLTWPIKCFVAVAFWNMLGAGVLGFMINPPVALYYIQGLNTTATHAHAALFGVYGFLAIGFVLLVVRYIRPDVAFNDKAMAKGFWLLNIGLVAMLFTSLLPIGILQAYASISQGLWFARSETFMQQDILQTLRWVRTFGDVLFIIGGMYVFTQVTKMLLKK